jgi:23S rRNA pseudouridine955/2504/2580 synthase
MQKITATAGPDDAGKRFDTVARRAFQNMTLSHIFRALRSGQLKLNGKKAPGATRIKAGDILSYYGKVFEVTARPEATERPSAGSVRRLPVIYENADIIIIDKPYGIKSHDGAESIEQLIVRQIDCRPSLSFKPAPVHRLDRNTTGLLVIARTITGARLFSERSRQKAIKKIYMGIIKGVLYNEECWTNRLSYHNGRSFEDKKQGLFAQTKVRPLKSCGETTLVLFELITGRSHQIRSQAALHGCPLLNDIKYGGGGNGHYSLHAFSIEDTSKDPLFPKTEYLPSFYKKFLC